MLSACTLLTHLDDLTGGAVSDGGDEHAGEASTGSEASIDSSPDASGVPDAPAGDAGCGVFALPGTSSLTDDFSQGLGPKWQQIGESCVSETGGNLLAEPLAGAALSYCRVLTVGQYHLACDELVVKVPEVTSSTLGAQTFIYVSEGSDHVVELILEGGGFAIGLVDGGTIAVTGPPFDPASDLWWKLRGAGGELFFETSADGATWNPRGHGPVPSPLTRVQISLGAGIYKPVASPGRARFRLLQPSAAVQLNPVMHKR